MFLSYSEIFTFLTIPLNNVTIFLKILAKPLFLGGGGGEEYERNNWFFIVSEKLIQGVYKNIAVSVL